MRSLLAYALLTGVIVAVCFVAIRADVGPTTTLPLPRRYTYEDGMNRIDPAHSVWQNIGSKLGCCHQCYARRWCTAFDYAAATAVCSLFNTAPVNPTVDVVADGGHTYASAVIVRPGNNNTVTTEQDFLTDGGITDGRRLCGSMVMDQLNVSDTMIDLLDAGEGVVAFAFRLYHNSTLGGRVLRAWLNGTTMHDVDTGGGMPFGKGGTYEICFVGMADHYRVTVNGASFTTFPHVVPPATVSQVRVTGQSVFYDVTF